MIHIFKDIKHTKKGNTPDWLTKRKLTRNSAFPLSYSEFSCLLNLIIILTLHTANHTPVCLLVVMCYLRTVETPCSIILTL